jgi:dTDP-4-dehydrorhamnose reductase
MRIALFGFDGMLGTKTAGLFQAAGHTLLMPHMDELDLTRPGDLERFYKKNKFEGAVNCAAFTAVDACEDIAHYPLALMINATAVGTMAKLAKATGRWLVHISTDYVFDGTGEEPWKVDAPIHPLNAYGQSKAMGETLFREHGMPGWIVRTSWLYGPGGKHFVKTMVGLLRTKERVEVVDDQTGGPTYTGDLARFLLLLAETKPEKGIYHYANEGFVTWHGFTRAIREELGIKACEVAAVTSERFTRPAPRPKNSRFDLSRAQSLPGAFLRPWREALRDYLKEDSL